MFLLSLNRAGEHYGTSLFCFPWRDETRDPEPFAEHDEELRKTVIDRQNLREARAGYPFLKGHWDCYDLLISDLKPSEFKSNDPAPPGH